MIKFEGFEIEANLSRLMLFIGYHIGNLGIKVKRHLGLNFICQFAKKHWY